MKALALDLGTQTGYAYDQEGSVYSGVFDLSQRRFEGGGMRYLRFERFLKELFADADAVPEEVVFEEVRSHLGTDAAHVYGGLMSILTSFCEKAGIPYRAVPVGTIKKHATGSGNAAKDDMMEAAEEQGWAPEDDNEADALWLLDLVQAERQRWKDFAEEPEEGPPQLLD